MKKINIAFVIDSLLQGGAETILVNTVIELGNSNEYNIYVITCKSTGDLLNKLPENVTHLHIPLNGIKSLIVLRKFLMENNISIIHAHLYNSIIFSRLAIWGKKIGLVQTYHNLDYCKNAVYYSKWRTLLEKFTFNQKFISIYVSEICRDCVESVRKSTTHYILPNFAGAEFIPNYKQSDKNELRIVLIGNLKKVKNISMAIQSLKTIRDKPIYLDVYGKGELKNDLQNEIDSTNSNVTLKGYSSMSSESLKGYDVILSTSFSEGMPITLLESLNVGLPGLLPSHLPIMKEIYGNAAVYFSINDHDSLSNQMLFLLNNKQALKEMSIEALRRREIFTLDSHIKVLEKIYHDMTSSQI